MRVDHKSPRSPEEQLKEQERRRQAAVTDAMSKAARAGLGNRGRIRAGERALTKVDRQIASGK